MNPDELEELEKHLGTFIQQLHSIDGVLGAVVVSLEKMRNYNQALLHDMIIAKEGLYSGAPYLND